MTHYGLGRQMMRKDILSHLIDALLKLGVRQILVARLLCCSNVTVSKRAKALGIRQRKGWKPGDPRNTGFHNKGGRPRSIHNAEALFTKRLKGQTFQ